MRITRPMTLPPRAAHFGGELLPGEPRHGRPTAGGPRAGRSIKADGVQDPVLIYTDGIFAKLGDGHHRVRSPSSMALPPSPCRSSRTP